MDDRYKFAPKQATKKWGKSKRFTPVYLEDPDLKLALYRFAERYGTSMGEVAKKAILQYPEIQTELKRIKKEKRHEATVNQFTGEKPSRTTAPDGREAS